MHARAPRNRRGRRPPRPSGPFSAPFARDDIYDAAAAEAAEAAAVVEAAEAAAVVEAAEAAEAADDEDLEEDLEDGRGASDDLGETTVLARRLIKATAHGPLDLALAEWLQVVDVSRLLWGMRAEGEQLRQDMASRLSLRAGHDEVVTPDPRGPIAFSAQEVIEEVARAHNMPLLSTRTDPALRAEQLHLSARQGMRIYAWIMTRADGEPPELVVDPDCPSMPHLALGDADGGLLRIWYPLAAVHAAECLAYVLHDWDPETGPAIQGGYVVLPPHPERETIPCVPPHTFRKALLGQHEECPPAAACACNLAFAWLRTPPPLHPVNTDMLGTLPADSSRPLRQDT
jgi:hypothetical protein